MDAPGAAVGRFYRFYGHSFRVGPAPAEQRVEHKRHRKRVHSWSMARAVLALLLIGGAATAAAQTPAQPGSPTPSPTAAPVITPIPIPEIAQRAEQVATLLRMAEDGMTDATVHDVEARLAATADWIRPRLVSTTEALASSPSSSALAYLADSWQMSRARLVGLNDTLTRR